VLRSEARRKKQLGMSMISAGKHLASLRAAQGKGDQGSMVLTETCSRTDCSKRIVTALGEEELCFDHFCARSYELLERADDATESPRDAAGCVEVLGRLDECARRAMEIALRQIELNNLERARVLDILLWSGDLISELRQKQNPREKTLVKESAGLELHGLMRNESRRVN
jgi:hypothetical protein